MSAFHFHLLGTRTRKSYTLTSRLCARTASLLGQRVCLSATRIVCLGQVGYSWSRGWDSNPQITEVAAPPLEHLRTSTLLADFPVRERTVFFVIDPVIKCALEGSLAVVPAVDAPGQPHAVNDRLTDNSA